MSLSVNGQSRVPPGFRFHPTEDELLHYYLRKKVANEKIDLDIIQDIDLNKLEPWDIQESCKIRPTPQNEWYFFSHKDKKYPTGTRTNRATAAGFWKATGRDKVIYSSFKRIGLRKTLVFYKGRAPHGQKSDWIMHEYRLDDQTTIIDGPNSMGETIQEDGWVVCRVFKKKNHRKTLNSPENSSITTDAKAQMPNTSNDGALDQILQYKKRTNKQENETGNTTTKSNSNNMKFLSPIEIAINDGIYERKIQLPALESPTLPSLTNDTKRPDPVQDCCGHACYSPIDGQLLTDIKAYVTNQSGNGHINPVHCSEPGIHDWAALDRFVASHLNGLAETCKQLACFNEPTMALCSPIDQDLQLPQMRFSNRSYHTSQDYSSESDLWSFMR